MRPQHDHPDILLMWPRERAVSPPPFSMPLGYDLRVWHEGDAGAWVRIQLHAVPTFEERDVRGRLERYLKLALPFGIFMVTHEDADEPVATAGCIHETRDGAIPFCGQIAWVATRPEHQRRGLGTAVCVAALTRLLTIGYEHLVVSTGDDLLPAIKIYLRLGFEPFLYVGGMEERWRNIMRRLDMPFEPENWPTPAAANPDAAAT